MRRRYSEFASLRNTLVNLHPTLIIPPIPEKHTTADYVAKPMKAKEDVGIIELRKRMLAVFLNRCRRMQEVREDGVWWRFLDPNVSWVCNTTPKPAFSRLSILTKNRARSFTLTQSRPFRPTGSRRLRSMLQTPLQATTIYLFHRCLLGSSRALKPRPVRLLHRLSTRPSLLLHRTVYPDRKSSAVFLLHPRTCPRKSLTHIL